MLGTPIYRGECRREINQIKTCSRCFHVFPRQLEVSVGSVRGPVEQYLPFAYSISVDLPVEHYSTQVSTILETMGCAFSSCVRGRDCSGDNKTLDIIDDASEQQIDEDAPDLRELLQKRLDEKRGELGEQSTGDTLDVGREDDTSDLCCEGRIKLYLCSVSENDQEVSHFCPFLQ